MKPHQGRAIIAGVSLLAAASGGGVVGHRLASGEQREAYPENLVCETTVGSGGSLDDLAKDSVYKLDVDDLVQRSQFINPDFILNVELREDGLQASHALNVSIGPEEPVRANDPVQLIDWERRASTCEFVNDWSLDTLLSTYPEQKAAAGILRSTVAVMEGSSRGNTSEIEHHRCGAIAVTPTILLMPAQERVWDDFDCGRVVSGETEDKSFTLQHDWQNDTWRKIEHPGVGFEPAEIAWGYEPQTGDVLIYSGYSQGGRRKYFRVEVAGNSPDGREILVRTGLDRNWPQDTEDFTVDTRAIRSGTGGFFTPDGRLVALSFGETELLDTESYYSAEYNERRSDHNEWLWDLAEEWGFPISYSRSNRNYDEDKFAFGLRVTDPSLTEFIPELKKEP